MKYWIFQNNQVLGPYEPDDLSKISAFSPESLVCSEGRRGTNMGDWQRAGMVPDLSVALVRASSSGGKTVALAVAGLPPEPTLQDFAALESISQKVAMLENVVSTLQESLRGKDTELSAVHGESETLKRQLASLEERLASTRLLGETLDKAVAEEKRVEHDVEKQGQTLNELAHEVENLRRRLEGRADPVAGAWPASAAVAAPAIPVENAGAPLSNVVEKRAPEIADFPTSALVGAGFEPISFGGPVVAPAPDPATAVPVSAVPAPAPESMSAQFQAPPSVSVASAADVIAAPAPAKSKMTLILGAVLGVGAVAALAVMRGYVPGVLAPRAPEAAFEPAPTQPPPAPEPAPDPRASAVVLAKAWPLRGGRTLGQALETLAPPSGNLSPWMAETLAGGRVQVNYFARGAAAGAPTIAYEFEVDLEGRTLVGRNAAAKSVLTGKAASPPAPPKAKRVRVKPKKAAAPKAKTSETETLDSLLGEPAAQSAPAVRPSGPAAEKTLSLPGWDGGAVSITAPGGLAPGPTPRPGADAAPAAAQEKPRSRPRPARRAAAAKGGEAAADESLLDDLLME